MIKSEEKQYFSIQSEEILEHEIGSEPTKNFEHIEDSSGLLPTAMQTDDGVKQGQNDELVSDDYRQSKTDVQIDYGEDESHTEKETAFSDRESGYTMPSEVSNGQLDNSTDSYTGTDLQFDGKVEREELILEEKSIIEYKSENSEISNESVNLTKRERKKYNSPVSNLKLNKTRTITKLAQSTYFLENQCEININVTEANCAKPEQQLNNDLNTIILNLEIKKDDETEHQVLDLSQISDKHIDDHNENTVSDCSKRPAKRKGHARLRHHILCDICGKYFKQKVHFTHHECLSGGKKPYNCNFHESCDKTFNNASNMKKHVDAVHLNLRNHGCQYCEKKFKTSGALKIHLGSIHSVGNHSTDHVEKYTCKLCGKFLSPSGFKAHVLLHSGEKNLTCSYGCGRQFYDKSNLKKHEMVHSGVKPHKCNTCGESFTRKQYLNCHMWKHTGEYSLTNRYAS